MDEMEKFLADIGSDQNQQLDVLNTPFNEPEKEPEDANVIKSIKEEDALRPKNRRERRLMEKLEKEREASIFLAGKLEARKEAEKFLTNEESDSLKGIEKIFGTETPEAQLATDILKKAFVGIRDEAKMAAIQEWKAEQSKAIEEEQKLSRELEGFIDDIEETYGVELTQAQEKSYLTLLKKMSPKDASGKIIGYADRYAVYDIFQEKLKATSSNTQAKEISNRSMTQSGASKETNLEDDSALRYLRENGII